MLYLYRDWKVSGGNWNATPTCFDSGGISCPPTYRPLTNWAYAQFERGRGVFEAGVPVPNSNSHFVVGDVPEPGPIGVWLEYKRKQKSERKAFEARRKAGDIVLNSLDQASITYRTTPGFRGIGTPSSYELVSPLQEGARGTLAERNPCNGYNEPGYLIMDTINYVEADPYRVPPGYNPGTMRRRYDVYTQYSAFTPSHLDVLQCWTEIQKHLDEAWDKGLITSLVAESNAGAIDLYTSLAEAKETVSWIFSLLRDAISQYRRTRRHITSLMRGKRTTENAAGLQSEVNNRWLEYRYAVTPLAYQIEDALQYLQSFFTPYQTFRDGRAKTINIETTDWVSTPFKVVDRCFVKHKYRAGVWDHNLGTSLAVTAWETIPLSFVIDWFLNIGDLLSALSTPSSVAQRAAQYSRQIPLGTEIVFRHKHYEGASVVFTGGYYNAIPFDPLLRVGVNIELNMTWMRWLDAFALSWNMLRSNVKR